MSTIIGWDMGAPEGDQTIYTVSQCRGGQLVMIYSGPDGAYAEALVKQLSDNRPWRVAVDDLPPGKFIVIDATKDTRRQVRWNGYRWEDSAETALEPIEPPPVVPGN